MVKSYLAPASSLIEKTDAKHFDFVVTYYSVRNRNDAAAASDAAANAFAVHIAATQGHILLIVDLMLALKVQAEDADGTSVEDYANKSRHKCPMECSLGASHEAEKAVQPIEIKGREGFILFLQRM